jgi:zinc D-Ala-D-Ala carboxypeptidase
MKLSTHFDLSEFTVSEAAARRGIVNDPPALLFANLKATAGGLEQVRDLLGSKPITISSGYRNFALNKAVGGAKDSQHMSGQAVDFICPAFGSPRQIVEALIGKLDYDQLILEFGSWVHISITDAPRKQVLIIDKHGTRRYS